MLQHAIEKAEAPESGGKRRRLRLLLRSFDALFAGLVALVLAFAFGLPAVPALVLGVGTGLLASSLCPVAARQGPSLLGVVLGGLAAAILASLLGLEAWPEIALLVTASLLAARVGRGSLKGITRLLLRTF